jgi:glucosamine-6-phosphate deaminase
MKSRAIICSVPDLRKAEAVRKTIENPVGPEVPASILRNHPSTWLYLDQEAASLLK